MTTTERRERERKARRQAILDAAEKAIVERGLGATTMEEVASAAELSKGALYLYFANKDALCAAIAERAIGRYTESLKPQLAGCPDGLSRIETILRTNADFFRQSPHYLRLALSWMIGEQQSDHDNPSFAAYRRRVGELVALVVSALTDGKNDGSVRQDIDPLLTAVTLWAASLGTHLLGLNRDELARRMPYPIDADALVPEGIEQALRALRRPGHGGDA